MAAYLFVHFKEKRTPDGEQVYFGISRDGFRWEAVNRGEPVLWSYLGDRGVRDFTIARTGGGQFVILATDLSLAYGMPYYYENRWENIARLGSKCLVMWKSEDLIRWSEQEMVKLGNEDFGCLWAPDILYDRGEGDYIVHWSSSHSRNDFGAKGISYSRTRDFKTFSEPRLLYAGEVTNSGEVEVIDSAIYEENGAYYMFLKWAKNPARVVLLRSSSPTGEYNRVEEFDRSMECLEEGLYEAPTAFRTADGRWCLMLDFYGCGEEGQGYVPFLADSLESGKFVRADKEFSFPYGFKHGTVLQITDGEYERLRDFRKPPSWR